MGRYYDFKTALVTSQCITSIQDWFRENGNECKALIGLTGSESSALTATLCVKALGKDRVIGVYMPDNNRLYADNVSKIVEMLDIPLIEIGIENLYSTAITDIQKGVGKVWKIADNPSKQMTSLLENLQISTLNTVSQITNGKIINTWSLTDAYVKNLMVYGDFAPLIHLTLSEVNAIGKYLKILCGDAGKTSEIEDLDRYIRRGTEEIDNTIADELQQSFKQNFDKMRVIPGFKPSIRLVFSGNF